MNKLETAILGSAVRALNRYEKIAGQWLWHAPEFFLTTYVANGIARKGWYVWCDASPSKIIFEESRSKRGHIPTNKNKRFDIVVWHKASKTVKAIIEVKRDWSITSLKGDRKKILKQKNKVKASANSGYLLVYSEEKHRKNGKTATETLEKRFQRWAHGLGATISGKHFCAPRKGEWAWGFALLRLF